MIKKYIPTPKTMLAAIAVVVAMVAGVPAAKASLQTKNNCTVYSVHYDPARLIILCVNSSNLYGYTSGTCAQSADTIRNWQSLAVSSLLSGKPLVIDYETTCGDGIKGITLYNP